MKVTKKLVCLALTMVMGLSTGLVGCGKKAEPTSTKTVEGFNKTGYPIVKDTVKLKLAASRRSDVKDFNELKFFKQIEEKTHVQVGWNSIPDEAWKEKLGLMFASNDLPDGFYGNWALSDMDVLKYGQQGSIIPLEKLIDEYAPNVKKIFESNPDYKKLVTAPDGHIYSLPVIDESYFASSDAFFINKKWLDAVGMAVPTTPDELYNVLKAFKGKDLNGNGKNDELPMSFRTSTNINGIYSLFGAFGRLDNKDHIVMDGDKVVFTADKPEYKEAIKYFNKLFKEGLIDQESFTHDNKVMTSKQQSKTPILGATMAWSKTSFTTDYDKCEYVAVPPLKGADGKQMWNRVPFGLRGKGAFAITSVCKTPEVAMRWANEMYDPKTSFQANNGLIGELVKENGDGTVEVLTVDKDAADKFKANIPGASCISVITKDFATKIKPARSIKEKRDMDELYKPYFAKNIYPLAFLTPEENQKMTTLNTDIMNYADQMYAKWMMKGGIDEEWDGYVKKLKQMGVDDLVKIKQDSYNRYKATK